MKRILKHLLFFILNCVFLLFLCFLLYKSGEKDLARLLSIKLPFSLFTMYIPLFVSDIYLIVR